MDKKLVYGTLAGTVVGMAIGALIFLAILGDQVNEWLSANAACVNQQDEMPMWAGILQVVLQAFIIAYLIKRFGISTVKGGAIAGALIIVVLAFWFDLTAYVTFKAMELSWIPIDVIANAVIGACIGAVVGWIYGKVK